jgi:Zn-dependent protease
MRDPLTWSFPLTRLFGILIRVHLLFPLVAIGLILRVAFQKDVLPFLWVEACVLMVLLFVSVLLHEFGHCFGARAVDGDATEVLLWPLGGLASTEVPHTPRANFITTAAGPAVNLVLCLAACVVLAFATLVPSFKPWADPYFPVAWNWSDHKWYGCKQGHDDFNTFTAYQIVEDNKDGRYVNWYDVDEANKVETKTNKSVREVFLHPDDVVLLKSDDGKLVKDLKYGPYGVCNDKEKKGPGVPVKAEALGPHCLWVVQVSRLFWLNWFLFLLNLVPAFPLDGGRLLQCLLWWRADYRQGTLTAIFVGFLMMLVFGVLSIVLYEPLVLGLALFMYVACRRQWILLETGGEESLFGYDFSEGYTSLERDQPQPAPPRRRQSWFQRWLQRRAERKMRREQEQREAEERRMDELLEKVQRVGMQGLTEEERRFLIRASARYRNNQG